MKEAQKQSQSIAVRLAECSDLIEAKADNPASQGAPPLWWQVAAKEAEKAQRRRDRLQQTSRGELALAGDAKAATNDAVRSLILSLHRINGVMQEAWGERGVISLAAEQKVSTAVHEISPSLQTVPQWQTQ